MEKKDILYIPSGLKNRREYVEGYGQKELVITFFVTVIGGLLDIIAYSLFHNLVVSILFIMIVPATTCLLVIRDISNISVVDQITFMIRFTKSQKKYDYRCNSLKEWQ